MANQEQLWKDLEDSIFEVLLNAFQRQECAAKAAARLEKVVVDRYTKDQEEPSTAAEDVTADYEGESSREFSSDQFLSLFTNTNLLKLVRELLDLMDLVELEEEICTFLIQDAFRQRPPASSVGQQRGGEGTQFIGSDTELFLHTMREKAARAQRNQR